MLRKGGDYLLVLFDSFLLDGETGMVLDLETDALSIPSLRPLFHFAICSLSVFPRNDDFLLFLRASFFLPALSFKKDVLLALGLFLNLRLWENRNEFSCCR